MRSKVKTIVSSGLVAGTLDITAAILIYAGILHKTTAEKFYSLLQAAFLRKRRTRQVQK